MALVEVGFMAAIVEGIYKQGKIELLQVPSGVPEGRVRVIVVSEPDRPRTPPRRMTFGILATGDMSTLEDFKEAEWHGEKKWGRADGQ